VSDLTAIDILMLPDEIMHGRAEGLNEEMRRSVLEGFALDANHTPHITLLQRYVRSADLDHVYEAVGGAIDAADPSSLELSGVKVAHMEVAAQPGLGLAGLVVQPSQGVLDLQAALIAAVQPYVESGGTAAAYVTTEDEPEINQDTITYIENYVPDHSGENYVAHVTVGLAKLDFLSDLESKPFEAFSFHLSGFAVFQLGNNGTAQRELKKWEVNAA
jgi:2'-5' RNA ligase superfamily